MSKLSGQLNIDGVKPTLKRRIVSGEKLRQQQFLLLPEIITVVAVVIFFIKVGNANLSWGINWVLTPVILVCGAFIPTLLRRRRLADIGLTLAQPRRSFVLLGWTCLIVFPVVFGGMWILRAYGVNLPLQPVAPQGMDWIGWLVYQLLYIAVAEEIFFRGYVQSNVLRFMASVVEGRQGVQNWVAIMTSAGIFAIAHIIVHGSAVSALTFGPGLVLGWLFIRTKSLLAPIFFHALANIFYCLFTIMPS